MPKLSVFLPVLATVLLTLGGSHAFVWWRLVRQTQLPMLATLVATTVLIAGMMAVPLALALGRQAPDQVGQWALWFAYVWFGSFFYLLLATLATTLLQQLVGLVPQAWLPELALGSALWRVRVLAGLAVALASFATAAALLSVRQGPHVRQVEVQLDRLPKALDGLRVVQISDLHVAALLKRPYVAQVVARTQALAPDLVLFTGDLVDGSVAKLAADIQPLGELHPPLGMYGITGNHEYYSGADAWLAHYASLGIAPLRNARVSVGRGDASFDLAGIDDWTAHNFGGGHGADLAKALAGRDPSRCLVLLAHQPRAAPEAQAAGVDLMLSGHTHGGQLWPFGWAVRLVQPYLRGLERAGKMQIYVNPGTGYWGPPMRLGAPAEITLLVLRSPAAAKPGF